MIVIGKKYVFDYPVEFTTLNSYSQHRGQTVAVIDICLDNDEEETGESMYAVKADDGWHGCAWESELKEIQ